MEVESTLADNKRPKIAVVKGLLVPLVSYIVQLYWYKCVKSVLSWACHEKPQSAQQLLRFYGCKNRVNIFTATPEKIVNIQLLWLLLLYRISKHLLLRP
jgi:hypothetical protein